MFRPGKCCASEEVDLPKVLLITRAAMNEDRSPSMDRGVPLYLPSPYLRPSSQPPSLPASLPFSLPPFPLPPLLTY
eukprot:2942551-Rhodomonas_salina.2